MTTHCFFKTFLKKVIKTLLPILFCALFDVDYNFFISNSRESHNILVSFLVFTIKIKVYKVIYKFKSCDFVKVRYWRKTQVRHHKCQAKTGCRFFAKGGLVDIGCFEKVVNGWTLERCVAIGYHHIKLQNCVRYSQETIPYGGEPSCDGVICAFTINCEAHTLTKLVNFLYLRR